MSRKQGKSVELNPAFETGTLNDGVFVDFPFLEPEQLSSLVTFMTNVGQGKPLPGKNKPSWQDNSGNTLPYCESYEADNYWHYHCGPSYSPHSNYSFTFDLGLNLYGLTSAEVIHYRKEGEQKVIIEGFMKIHEPFPRSNDPDKENPLFPDPVED
ncbi:TPA: hypothetical protein RQO57_003576 [Aeromonas dhakensis]|uniref:hypothetical protein n=1 Tax=Aeromonas dhakensis TaxID=196024 RepID=UPI0028907261|nr:hypothetical protein [Aeromonas dhakensis]